METEIAVWSSDFVSRTLLTPGASSSCTTGFIRNSLIPVFLLCSFHLCQITAPMSFMISSSRGIMVNTSGDTGNRVTTTQLQLYDCTLCNESRGMSLMSPEAPPGSCSKTPHRDRIERSWLMSPNWPMSASSSSAPPRTHLQGSNSREDNIPAGKSVPYSR